MQKRKRTVKREAIKATIKNTEPELLTKTQAKTLIEPEPAEIKEGDVEQEVKPILTITDIRSMGVIKLHAAIREMRGTMEYAKCADLLDIFGREELQKRLIDRLGL